MLTRTLPFARNIVRRPMCLCVKHLSTQNQEAPRIERNRFENVGSYAQFKSISEHIEKEQVWNINANLKKIKKDINEEERKTLIKLIRDQVNIIEYRLKQRTIQSYPLFTISMLCYYFSTSIFGFAIATVPFAISFSKTRSQSKLTRFNDILNDLLLAPNVDKPTSIDTTDFVKANRFLELDSEAKTIKMIEDIQSERVDDVMRTISRGHDFTESEKETLSKIIRKRISIIEDRISKRHIQSYPLFSLSMTGLIMSSCCSSYYDFLGMAISMAPLVMSLSPARSKYKIDVFERILKDLKNH